MMKAAKFPQSQLILSKVSLFILLMKWSEKQKDAPEDVEGG